MPISYGEADLKGLDIEAIREVINNAEYSAEIVIVKGAPIPKPKSKYADQPEVDDKYRRVNTSMSLDVGSLPTREAQFLLDAFDRFSTLEKGMLVLKESCAKLDYEEIKVKGRIADYAHKKVDKLFADGASITSIGELPSQQVIAANEQPKTGFFGRIREAVSVGNSLGR